MRDVLQSSPADYDLVCRTILLIIPCFERFLQYEMVFLFLFSACFLTDFFLMPRAGACTGCPGLAKHGDLFNLLLSSTSVPTARISQTRGYLQLASILHVCTDCPYQSNAGVSPTCFYPPRMHRLPGLVRYGGTLSCQENSPSAQPPSAVNIRGVLQLASVLHAGAYE